MNAPAHTMDSSPRPWQRIGALGIVYSILYFIGALFLAGSQPDSSDSPTKVVTYYANHHVSVTISVFVIAVAMVVFAFFLTSLRRALSRSGPDGEHLSIAAIVGGAVYIGGFLVGSLINLALADAGHNHQATVTQTLNYLAQDSWLPVVVGLSITALAVGIAGLRNQTLPRWLAWASVVLGVLAIAGPAGAIAFLITPLWTIALSIVLMRRSAHTVDADVTLPGVPMPVSS